MPLLFETGAYKLTSPRILVAADAETQVGRGGGYMHLYEDRLLCLLHTALCRSALLLFAEGSLSLVQ